MGVFACDSEGCRGPELVALFSHRPVGATALSHQGVAQMPVSHTQPHTGPGYGSLGAEGSPAVLL